MINKTTRKQLDEAVRLARLLKGMSIRLADQQKLYSRMMSKCRKVAETTRMTLSDVLEQVEKQANKFGPLNPAPGKDV